MVSGLAPGSVAVMAMVGKSTRGSSRYRQKLVSKGTKTINDAVISVVITGRRIQASEIPILCPRLCLARSNTCAVDRQQLPVAHDRLPLQDPWK